MIRAHLGHLFSSLIDDLVQKMSQTQKLLCELLHFQNLHQKD